MESKIEAMIYEIRGQKVMTDYDLATLYNVPTKRLNEQVNRNLERFPQDFSFVLNNQDVISLRSQIATSSLTFHGGKRYIPRVFTEHGILMLSSVLKSERAIEVNIQIMRSFVEMRRSLIDSKDKHVMKIEISNLKRTTKDHHEKINAIFIMIDELSVRPSDSYKKRRIGFMKDDD
jgi:hypothetical protein